MRKMSLTWLMMLIVSATFAQTPITHDGTVTINPSHYGPKLILDDANTANKVPIEFRSSNIIKWELGTRKASEQYDLALWRYYNSSYLPVMWFNNDNGNVGIGTTTPDEKFHVAGSSTIVANIGIPTNNHWETGSHTLELQNNDAGEVVLSFHRAGYTNASIRHTSAKGLIFSGNGGSNTNHFQIMHDGKIGVGTNSPEAKLEINSSGAIYTDKPSLLVKDISSRGTLFLESVTDNPTDFVFKNNNRLSWVMSTRGSSDNYALRIYPSTNGTSWTSPIMSLQTSGSVGIGTTSTGTHKLAVEGSIGAREIKVEAPPGWSDFVFEKDYELRTLEEVENFIAENKHLPEIPSEAEVTENGINLGEMDAKLLQKIEELTLYLIEQNKQNKTQQELIEQLQKEVSALKNE